MLCCFKSCFGGFISFLFFFVFFFWGGFCGTPPPLSEVLEVVDGGSAKEDGSIRAWDVLEKL